MPLTGQETESWKMLYFKVYKSQLQVIERALETASLMLGSEKVRGYCLEMICADFLAGANLGERDSDAFSVSVRRLIDFLPAPEKIELIHSLKESTRTHFPQNARESNWIPRPTHNSVGRS